MTPGQFAEIFPGRSFAIRYVQRGGPNERKWVWLVQFTADYFTSDTDQLVTHCRDAVYATGDLLPEALEILARAQVCAAETRARVARERLAEVEAEERALKQSLGA